MLFGERTGSWLTWKSSSTKWAGCCHLMLIPDDSEKKRIAAEESENALRMDCKKLEENRDHGHAKFKSFGPA